MVCFKAVEIEELNDMLTEAGDTFHQKDDEIESMKKIIAEYEEKVKQQVSCISLFIASVQNLKAKPENKRLNEKFTRYFSFVFDLKHIIIGAFLPFRVIHSRHWRK